MSQPAAIPKYFRYQEDKEDFFAKPSLTNMILDLDKGTILSRTPLRWLQLLIFYIIFYCCIALLWWASYNIFENHISYERPKWYMKQPGFGFHPATVGNNHLLIYYNESSEEEVQNIVNHVKEKISNYGNIPQQYFETCDISNNFGYKDHTLEDLPQDAPSELLQYLQSRSQADLKERIWISCQSKPELKFHYFPHRFYETSAVEDFSHSELKHESVFERVVAIQPEGISINTKYNIRCYLWAKNIVRDSEGEMGKGLIKFKLRILSG